MAWWPHEEEFIDIARLWPRRATSVWRSVGVKKVELYGSSFIGFVFFYFGFVFRLPLLIVAVIVVCLCFSVA